MKKFKFIVLLLVVLATVVVVSSFAKSTSVSSKKDVVLDLKKKENQTINMFVTHGHCSTPFSGIVNDLQVVITPRLDLGNPLEAMTISFEIDPNSFKVCKGDALTERIKTPGLFIGKPDEKMTFRTTNVYTMGLDWYQVNGFLSIKGIEKEVKLFVTGIRNPKDSMASSLVLQGQMNLLDWGIDYDLIVTGTSVDVPTKWLYLQMTIDLS
jgi:polyisoprenoid-binding protein YceI